MLYTDSRITLLDHCPDERAHERFLIRRSRVERDRTPAISIEHGRVSLEHRLSHRQQWREADTRKQLGHEWPSGPLLEFATDVVASRGCDEQRISSGNVQGEA